MIKALKKVFAIALRLGISAALLVFLFRQVDLKGLLEIIAGADKMLLAAGFFFYFLLYAFCLFRWDMLLRAADIRLPLGRVVISFAGGTFFNLFLPSSIGGDFMRSLDLAAHTRKAKEVVATVLLDRLSGYVGMVAVCLCALALGWRLIEDGSVYLVVAILAVLLIAILAVLFNNFLYNWISRALGASQGGRIRQALKDLHQEIYLFRGRRKAVAYNLLLSLLVQVASPLSYYFIGLSLGIKVNMMYYFVFMPVIGAITLLPISIGGLGLRDATTIYFFAKAGVPRDLSFAMSLISFLFIIIHGAAGGLIYVLTLRHRRIQSDQPPALRP